MNGRVNRLASNHKYVGDAQDRSGGPNCVLELVLLQEPRSLLKLRSTRALSEASSIPANGLTCRISLASNPGSSIFEISSWIGKRNHRRHRSQRFLASG